MKKIILGFTISIVALNFTACNTKIPPAKKVDWNKDFTSISNKMLNKKIYQVPKEPVLKNKSFLFKATAEKIEDDLFENEAIVKLFLIAHNSSEISISGRKDLILEYANYFLKNGVNANIKLFPKSQILAKNINKVNIVFINKIQGDRYEKNSD